MAVCPRSVCEMANPYGQAILYLLLLFSPISLTLLVTQRLYRMAIVPGMVLVVFSSMIGLTLRKGLPLTKQLPWAFLTGLTLAFFWQIREDSVWILPFIAVMTVWNVGYVILVLHKKLNTKALLLHCLTMLLPLLLLFGANTGVSVVNRIHYGVFLNNDRTEGNFAELMSVLYHLDSNTRTNPDIWISRDTIVRAEAASPTLQQISHYWTVIPKTGPQGMVRFPAITSAGYCGMRFRTRDCPECRQCTDLLWQRPLRTAGSRSQWRADRKDGRCPLFFLPIPWSTAGRNSRYPQ